MIENKNSEIIPETIPGQRNVSGWYDLGSCLPTLSPVRLEVRPSNRMGHAVLAHQA
jgi:hypothetical protein